MPLSTKYVAKVPDSEGFIEYTAEEDATWATLYERQDAHIQKYACKEYLAALATMNLPRDRVPQCPDVSAVLRERTGWCVEPVPALIPATEFFTLLSKKHFPAASFIRRPEDLDYIEEPDIFHEVFGHTPHLTDKRFSAFTHAWGKAGLSASEEDRRILERLYWFTVEFGLVARHDGPGGVKAYGAGLLSSIGELAYSLDSPVPDRRPFDPIEILRTPFRIDRFQSIYYVIDSFDDLFDLADQDLMGLIREAKRLGMYEPDWQQIAS